MSAPSTTTAHAASMPRPLISLDRLHAWFAYDKPFWGKVKTWIKPVNNISLDIIQGECLGLVGESGCGKSTLGRAILRLTPLTSGTIQFQGHPIESLNASALKPFRPKMQMVFQDPKASLNPRMNVLNILKEALVLNREVDPEHHLEESVRLLSLVDLRPEHLFRFPREFSGGQQQRISIARALATNPRFIVFDEATSALDVSVQAQVISLMKTLQHQLSLTYLFISHDLSIMEQVCARVAVMYAGQIVEVQDSTALFNAPRHPYTKALKDAVPIADPLHKKDLGVLKGEVPKLSSPPKGCHFHPRCDFRQDLCQEQEPAPCETDPNSWVKCHFHEQLWKQGALKDH
ncbi:MAG: ABC transporter ATP-binding protein [Desulfobacteraceae bacterium]|nr:MAG: ABC transporter ATP-binding protein [Desulfobacteraceae bacterium]